MKNVIFTLFIVYSAFLMPNNSYSQSHKLNSVKIELVDFDIETVIDVNCETFDYTFNNGEKRTNSYFEKKDLMRFQSLLGNFKTVKSKKSIDVRGSISYNSGKTSSKYCFDVFGYFYKDGKYYYNKPLLIYIADQVYSKHPKYLDTLRQYE